MNIGNAKYAEDVSAIDAELSPRYSKAYLRHLFKASEPLGARIATLHNLAFYARLMGEIRSAITDGSWLKLMARYQQA